MFGATFYPQDIIDDFIENNQNLVNVFEGKPGTIIIADTTGFHRGGYVQSDSRLMLTLVFYPKYDPIRSRVRFSIS